MSKDSPFFFSFFLLTLWSILIFWSHQCELIWDFEINPGRVYMYITHTHTCSYMEYTCGNTGHRKGFIFTIFSACSNVKRWYPSDE